MEPIYIILYAVIVTLLLVLIMPRLRQASPALRRILWIAFVVGGVGLLIVIYLTFMG